MFWGCSGCVLGVFLCSGTKGTLTTTHFPTRPISKVQRVYSLHFSRDLDLRGGPPATLSPPRTCLGDLRHQGHIVRRSPRERDDLEQRVQRKSIRRWATNESLHASERRRPPEAGPLHFGSSLRHVSSLWRCGWRGRPRRGRRRRPVARDVAPSTALVSTYYGSIDQGRDATPSAALVVAWGDWGDAWLR